MRRGKFIFVGLPFILLIAYVIWVPSPTITKIDIRNDLGYIADGYDFRIVQLTPEGTVRPLSFEIFDSGVRNFDLNPNLNQAYVITNDGLVSIINIEEPINPHKLTYFDTPGIPQAVAIRGDFAYIADGLAGVQIFSIQQISQPSRIGFLSNLGFVSDIVQVENLTYVVRSDQGMDIYDLSNYTEPRLLGHYDAGGIIGQTAIEKVTEGDGRVWIRGILLVAQRAVQTVDFTDPQQPGLLNSYDFASISNTPIKKAFIRGRRIFALQEGGGILISRVNDDGQLEQLARITDPRPMFDFAITGDTAFLAGGIQGLQAYNFSDINNIHAVGRSYSNFLNFKIRIAFISFFFLLLWLAFFAQFVLPVRTFRQRQKILDRLILFLVGGHGPAISIENGHIVERAGESEKKGPGVVWLDTASAAVIRTATKFKEAIGPGVHFTEKGEYLAGPLDLHTQVDSFGPTESDKPFVEKDDNQTDEAYNEVQKRRILTSALTRDGIEVVPKITVVFRVNTIPAEDGQPGSRFGYRVATNQKEKDSENEDKKAIYNAIAGEGIDPTAPEDMPRHRVAWNQLPGRLAADLWREYAAKFILDELFDQTQEIPPPLPDAPKPEPEGPSPTVNPSLNENKDETIADALANMLHIINNLITNVTESLDNRNKDKSENTHEDVRSSESLQAEDSLGASSKKTALQVINEMVKKRLTQPTTETLSDTGVRTEAPPMESREYKLLNERGLKVISVSINNLHFNEIVDKQIVSQWTSNWHNNAKSERERIERRQRYIEMSGEEEGANEYVHALARHITKQKPGNLKETLRALLMRTRLVIVHDNQLQNRMNTERQDIDDILTWLENGS